MKWITPFAYIDDAGVMHLCVDLVCKDLGFPLTEENLRLAEENLTALMKQAQPGTEIRSNVEQWLRENPEKIDRRPEAEIFAEEVAAVKKWSVS